MMQIIKPNTKIDFIGKLKIFFTASIIAIVLCFGLIFIKGYNLGIDFAGGTIIQVKFESPVHVDRIRQELTPVIKDDFVIQDFDRGSVLIRVVEHESSAQQDTSDKTTNLQKLSDDVKAQLSASFAAEQPSIQMVEQIGPQVGKDLRKKAISAALLSIIGILIYVAIRFRLKYGIAAVIALVHDVIIILGIYSLSGKEFNLTVLAAVLTAAGYSLNDTIVVFDRIREKVKSGALQNHTWKEVVNKSINETLSRTILTSLLTFMAVLSLFIFGGTVLNGFALVMMIGIVVGTYSSFAIAAMIMFILETKQKKVEGKVPEVKADSL